ncbi:MAG: enoyl-CoA hydratase/isomerase family protein [Sulfitobacter sp.]|nr:enoyl-CoA hydratase/isomerase family protein [Sulfitobacter sp.]
MPGIGAARSEARRGSLSGRGAVRIERDGRVLTFVNDDPPINRMTLEYIDEIEAVLEDVRTDDSVRVVVFTADGEDNFSVGMDLKQLRSEAADRGGFEAVLDQRRRVLRTLETMGKPSIATLFGYCLGGGLELPLACTFRLAATEGCKIGLPELDLGAVPAWGGSVRLTRTVGPTRALDMMLRHRMIGGPESLDIGLVSEIHPVVELKSRAHALAHELARGPRLAMRGVMDAVQATLDHDLDTALDAEREAVRACQGTPDQAEGGMAFLEKREPVFE